MSRARRLQHAQYLRHAYVTDFPDSERYNSALIDAKAQELPTDFFQRLLERGYGFSDSLNGPYEGLGTDKLLERLKRSVKVVEGGLEVNILVEFNIFRSTKKDARLLIIKRDGSNFAFLTADYGNGQETCAVVAEKREYAQPLLLHEVLKRAQSGVVQ